MIPTSGAVRASICMASFNGERFIGEQLESILRQLGADDEVVISDDGSTDDTVQAIRRFQDRRIRLFASSHVGVTRSFENALARAAGQYIFLSDQDDVWLDGKLAQVCAALRERDLVVTDCKVVDAQGAVLHDSYFRLVRSGPGVLRNLLRNSYLGCCMAFHRRLLDLALPMPSGVAHDYWIGMLAELKGRPYFLPHPLLLYRRHGNTASFAAGKSARPVPVRIAERWTLARHLLTRWLKAKAK